MKAKDVLHTWAFTPNPTDDSEVECRECGEWSQLAEWEEGFVDCDTCGDHSSMVCPKCGENYDHVWSNDNPLKTREPSQNCVRDAVRANQ